MLRQVDQIQRTLSEGMRDIQSAGSAMEQHVGEDCLDYVLVNNGELRGDLLGKYQLEGKAPVRLKRRETLIERGIKIVERDFTSDTDYIRHDPRKLARAVEDFASGWIR